MEEGYDRRDRELELESERKVADNRYHGDRDRDKRPVGRCASKARAHTLETAGRFLGPVLGVQLGNGRVGLIGAHVLGGDQI